MLNRYSILIIFVMLGSGVYAQSFEKYKERQRQLFQESKERQSGKIEELRKSYAEYVQERNEEFAKYVLESWENFSTIKGEKYSEEPKPEILPEYNERQRQEEIHEIKSIKSITLSYPANSDVDIVRIRNDRQSPAVPFFKNINFDFYGQNLTYGTDPRVSKILPEKINKNGIASALDAFLKTDYENLLDQIFETKEEFNLNDWGLLLLVRSVSSEMTNNENYARIFSWAMLNMSGYDAKIGIGGEDCYLMIASAQKMYHTYSLLVNGTRYYILDDYEGADISTYKHEFEGRLKVFDFNINKAIELGGRNSFEMAGDNAGVYVNDSVDKNLIDFYDDYPLMEPSVYFNAPMSAVTRNYLHKKLTPRLEGKSEEEKIGCLLDFVQNGFAYKSDRVQFDREKFFFPEELFYYPYSDCEDRSVLFAYLVRWLVGNDVVGLHYPGHMSTAVAITGVKNGDFVKYNDRVFTICDPTYRNAPIGMAMPEYKDLQCQVIPMKNEHAEEDLKDFYLQQLCASGAVITCADNSVFDTDGKCFIAGGYKNGLTIGGNKISAGAGNTNVFLACFNKNKELAWLRDVDVEKNDMLNGMALCSGSVCLNVSSSDSCDSSFVSCVAFSSSGDKLWIESWGMSPELYGENAIRTIRIGTDGHVTRDETFFSGEPVVNSDIYADGGEIVLNCNCKSALGLRREDLSVNTYAEANISSILKNVYQKFIDSNYEPYTAAVMSVFDVLKNNGMKFSGDDLLKLLNESSPELIETLPDLFKNLKQVKYIKNENGVIVLRTVGQKKVAIYKMFFSDKATVKLVDVNDSKTEIECLSGVQVGNKMVKLPLNNISVNVLTGNFRFDYGARNSKTVVNLKKDILKI